MVKKGKMGEKTKVYLFVCWFDLAWFAWHEFGEEYRSYS